MSAERPRPRRWWRWLALVWVVSLAGSHVWRRAHPWRPALESGALVLEVPLHDRSGPVAGAPPIRIALDERAPEAAGPPVVLLHGSPGSRDNLDGLAAALTPTYHTLSVDLPGFGASTRALPDHSNRALARMLLALLERMEVPRAHLVGYSMGGGVALEAAALAPERVASLTLLSSIGVQELELFGDYTVNHAVHGAQVALLWLLHEGVPHFGAFDGGMLSVAYARNFYDTDQRPLRAVLRDYDGPLLVLHGSEDSLAPYAVAVESARLAPQARLVPLEGGHMLVFTEPDALAAPLSSFLDDVEAGRATERADAGAEARAAADAPFDPRAVPALTGVGLLVFGLLTMLATLVSEDLTCVAVGALVGQGRVGLAAGALACFLGIYVGDLLVFLAGRVLGRRAVHRAPLRWFLSEARVERSSDWFRSRGAAVIFVSRFLPGARLPTYFAAGMLRTSFVAFALWFALAAGIWTPLVVWASSLLSGSLTERVDYLQENGLVLLGVTVLLGLLVVKVLVPMTTHTGRRLLVGAWRRRTRWEYWPPWLVYPPAVVAALLEGLRLRRPMAFTAANPAIPHAGFVGESKVAILRACAGAGARLPAWEHVARRADPAEVDAALARLQAAAPAPWPVVVKPDVGQRGDGVTVARSRAEVHAALEALAFDGVLQAFVPGEEYGLFWVHHPDEPEGSLFSVVAKVLPRVRGDGRRTLARLILDDERAVAMAPFFLDQNRARLAEVPADGEDVLLGELGTHCKGATFLDARELVTPALTAAVAEFAASFRRPDGRPGFSFGRLDVRARDAAALGRGEFGVLEVNGVTSEAAHVYDPRHGVWTGWSTFAAQWRRAQRVGAAHARAGAPTSGPLALAQAVRAWRRALAAAEREAAARPGAEPLASSRASERAARGV